MKKIYFSLMLAVAALFTACDMDKAPFGSLDESTAIQSMNDISRYRNIMYTGMRSMSSGVYLYCPEIQMDMFHGVLGNGNRGGEYSNAIFNSSSSDIEDIWAACYSHIATANDFMDKVTALKESGQFEGDSLTKLGCYEGEAYFYRAYNYYYLVEKFCQPYNSNNATTAHSGLPLTTKYAPSGDVETYPDRSTLAETYELIEEDLQKAYTGISAYEALDKSNVAPMAAYISSYTVLAMQARVALQKKDYATALAKAEQVINSGVYTLCDTTNYDKMWTEDTGPEILFRPFESKSEGLTTYGSNFLNQNEHQADYIPTFEMLLLYGDGDVRFDSFFNVWQLAIEGSNYYAYVFYKFPGNEALKTSTTRNFANMMKPFRLSEMYLVAAEAAAESGNNTAANKYLNGLRKARIIGYEDVNTPANALISQIREERLKELIGEGFRMSDLRRWGVGFQRDANHQENPNLNSVIVAAGRSMSYEVNDHRYTWPIPSTEIDANPKLKDQQNPGY